MTELPEGGFEVVHDLTETANKAAEALAKALDNAIVEAFKVKFGYSPYERYDKKTLDAALGYLAAEKEEAYQRGYGSGYEKGFDEGLAKAAEIIDRLRGVIE